MEAFGDRHFLKGRLNVDSILSFRVFVSVCPLSHSEGSLGSFSTKPYLDAQQPADC